MSENDNLHKILEAQAKTHTLLESHVKYSDERHTDIKEKILDHEKRIRKGETWRAKVMGWAIGAGVLSGAAAETVKAKFGL